jgi:four helix bundle protein
MANHKDLEVWKESMILAKEIYLLSKTFPKEEIYGITSQVRRCSVSIPSNIAEGAARSSDKEFIQFLYIALGSLAELETQIILIKDFGYIKNVNIMTNIESVRKMLIGLIKYLKNKTKN